MSEIHPTVVEFVDTRPDTSLHVTKQVRINGTIVTVLDGWNLRTGGNEATMVEMTLVATEVHFVHETAVPDRSWLAPLLRWAEEGEVLNFGGADVPRRVQAMLESHFGVTEKP